jgi:hypothetical protein
MQKIGIEMLNAVSANVWAMVCILAGALLCFGCLRYGKSIEPGTLLIGGGLTLLQRGSRG